MSAKKAVSHSWEDSRTVVFSARATTHSRAFSGSARLVAYTGSDPKIGGAALVSFVEPEAKSAVQLMCSYSGGVAEAVLVAAGLRKTLKLAPISAAYADLGGPVGIAEDSLRDGTGVFKIVFYRR